MNRLPCAFQSAEDLISSVHCGGLVVLHGFHPFNALSFHVRNGWPMFRSLSYAVHFIAGKQLRRAFRISNASMALLQRKQAIFSCPNYYER